MTGLSPTWQLRQRYHLAQGEADEAVEDLLARVYEFEDGPTKDALLASGRALLELARQQQAFVRQLFDAHDLAEPTSRRPAEVVSLTAWKAGLRRAE